MQGLFNSGISTWTASSPSNRGAGAAAGAVLLAASRGADESVVQAVSSAPSFSLIVFTTQTKEPNIMSNMIHEKTSTGASPLFDHHKPAGTYGQNPSRANPDRANGPAGGYVPPEVLRDRGGDLIKR
jgi:hypothetical protein